ncbi:Hypothetical predicted protein [Pelobates cultripes]|uniref:Reverse transcriptase domain-containing protein n=1 Tax=Pelobates cultripes TaxID=61616 RepID=A0AAD1RTQ4_PELCU|nr:Hypothetical predicted protein [Pelobates cultripes]
MTWLDHNPIRIRLKSPLFRPRQTTSLLTRRTTRHPCCAGRLRGHFIAHCSARKKAHSQTITDLNKDIAELEYRYKQTLDPSTYRELLLNGTQLTGHLNRAIQRSFQQFQHMVYEHGNKCGRLLATLLKKRRNYLYIPKIQNAAGRMCHLPDQISAAFTQYYEDLYNLRRDTQAIETPRRSEAIRVYLDSAELNQIDASDRDELEAPITMEELACTIKKAKTSKALGLPLLYYKTLLLDLLPKLHSALNSILDGATLSTPFTAANITLLLKDVCASYCPISVLDVDVKLLASVMAGRLAPLLLDMVKPDQTGFIPRREHRH